MIAGLGYPVKRLSISVFGVVHGDCLSLTNVDSFIVPAGAVRNFGPRPEFSFRLEPEFVPCR